MLIACATVAIVSGVTACSSEESAESTTTTTSPPASTVPTMPEQEPAEPEEPPEPDWIVQIGGPANDALYGVTSRDDEVVSTGYTEGALEGANSGARDVLVALVGTDGEVRELTQAGGPASESASGVASSSESTVACGSTASDLGAPNGGAEDAWCASIGASGALTTAHQQGGTQSDVLVGVALEPEGTFGYAGGYTLGLFPGASDTSGGRLGAGDALMWQITPDGTPLWIRQFGTETIDRGQGVATTYNGDGLIVGYTQGSLDGPSNGGTDGFIARFDHTGIPRFVRQFGTPGADMAKAVATGGQPTRGTETYVTVGSTDGAMAPALGAELTDPADAPRADGGAPAASNAGATDAMVVAVDPGGETRWTTQLGSKAAEGAAAVGIDGTTVLVGGTTAGTLDTTGAPNAGGRDGFLAAIDLLTGELRWITQFGSEGHEDVHGLTITEDGLVIVSGQTTGALDEAPNAGGSDGFLIAFPLPSTGGSVASAL